MLKKLILGTFAVTALLAGVISFSVSAKKIDPKDVSFVVEQAAKEVKRLPAPFTAEQLAARSAVWFEPVKPARSIFSRFVTGSYDTGAYKPNPRAGLAAMIGGGYFTGHQLTCGGTYNPDVPMLIVSESSDLKCGDTARVLHVETGEVHEFPVMDMNPVFNPESGRVVDMSPAAAKQMDEDGNRFFTVVLELAETEFTLRQAQLSKQHYDELWNFGLSMQEFLESFQFEYKKSDWIALSKNIYYESRGEPVTGQYAAAKITLTRAQGNFYNKDTVEKIVYHAGYSKKLKRRVAHFSWTENPYPIKELEKYRLAKRIARNVLRDRAPSQYLSVMYRLRYVYHYLRYDADAQWEDNAILEVRIGNHEFKRLKPKHYSRLMKNIRRWTS